MYILMKMVLINEKIKHANLRSVARKKQIKLDIFILYSWFEAFTV